MVEPLIWFPAPSQAESVRKDCMISLGALPVMKL